ncbi:hypothetical protein ACFYKX_10775 [Cytobacillus sp. FJAT-54145]|uniref:Uncharacterized protein n=1 Tax=Cytobacillus spartinae TaxID=3299023 RepID=A0ABW6KE54_9BACI
MSLLQTIKQRFSKKEQDPRLGTAWITEVRPIYSDRAGSTNKRIWVTKEFLSEEVVTAVDLEHPNSSMFEQQTAYPKNRLLTQNNVPIRFNRKGKPINYDPTFEKEGYKEGQLYHFEGLGFLGNIEGVEKVWLVTDTLVLFRTLKSESLLTYSYKELEILKPTLKQ